MDENQRLWNMASSPRLWAHHSLLYPAYKQSVKIMEIMERMAKPQVLLLSKQGSSKIAEPKLGKRSFEGKKISKWTGNYLEEWKPQLC